MRGTVIIGAGIAGLATAALLAREGHEVLVLEKNARVGGRAGTLEAEGFRFDTGPSWYLMPRVFDHFFELLGTTTAEQLELVTLDPGYRVFREPVPGAPAEQVSVPHGRVRAQKLFESLEPGAGDRLGDYLDSAAHASTMAERFFLYNTFTRWRSLLVPEVLGELPRLAGLLLRSLRSHAAARFRHPVIRQILGYPAVFLGTNPAAAPAMYHLMSSLDLDEGVQYPIGGFWQLVQRMRTLAEQAGARIVTEAEATRISCTLGRSPRVTGVHWRGADGAERYEPARVVVSAADLHHTETRLLPPRCRSRGQRWWRRRVSGPGAVLVMLGVRDALPQLPHHSLLFTRDWEANFRDIFGRAPRVPEPASLYVCKPSASDDSVAPPGHENLFLLVPVPADPGLGGGGDAAIEAVADAAIAQLASWAGIPDLSERIVVRRTLGPADFERDYHSWRGGMLGPAHILSQSAMFRPQNASKRLSGLYFAGGTVAPGVGVPMCLISAELVLKHLRADHSAGPTATKPVPEPAKA